MQVALEGRVERDAVAARSDGVEQLWRRYKREGGDVLRTRLVVHYMRTHVQRLAERLHSSLPQQVELDDLIQQGYLGLAEAIDRFDIDRDVRFETFSARRICGSMRDYLRAIDPMPRPARTRLKQLTAAEEDHRKRHGIPPSEQDLQRRLEVSAEKLRRILAAGPPPAMVSYQAAQPQADFGDDGDAMEAFADRSGTSPLTEAEKNDLRRWITRGFSRRDHLIVILYYYEHLTMREVGRTLGISESRVSQRLELILQRLRARLCYGEAHEEFY
jgi:RNA polymerase sigma factor for flagellar operon FliA